MSHLQFSIDLSAELAKITQRQHLNAVHFLVNLVRHSQSLGTEGVSIQAKGKHLRFSQVGQPLQEQELENLNMLLAGTGSNAEQQAALETLERQFGITLLALFRNSAKIQLTTGSWLLKVENHHYERLTLPSTESGYRLELELEQKAGPELLNELVYFCTGASAPINFNGKTINRPIPFTPQLCTLPFKTPNAEGSITIPHEGDLCSVTFYKAGVLLGSRSFLPDNGRVYHGYFNNFDPCFEPTYKDTITLGEHTLDKQAEQIYEYLPAHFDGLSHPQKQRIKHIVMDPKFADWHKACPFLPLFHTVTQDFVLSLTDLANYRKLYTTIPYSEQRSDQLPPSTLLLEPLDRLVAGPDLQKFRLSPPPLDPPPAAPTTKRLDVMAWENLPLPAQRLLHLLNELSADDFFACCYCGSYQTLDALGRRLFVLDIEHPLIKQTMLALPTDQGGRLRLKYRILASLFPAND